MFTTYCILPCTKLGAECFTCTASKGLSERVTPRIESQVSDLSIPPSSAPFVCHAFLVTQAFLLICRQASSVGTSLTWAPLTFLRWSLTLSWLTAPRAIDADSVAQFGICDSGQAFPGGPQGLAASRSWLGKSGSKPSCGVPSFYAVWFFFISGHMGYFHSSHFSVICLLSHLYLIPVDKHGIHEDT